MAKAAPAPRLAVVGSESLLGRELRESLSNQHLASQVDLVTDTSGEDLVLSEAEGDPVVMSPLERGSLTGAKVIFLAGSPSSAIAVQRMKLGSILIDLTATLDGVVRAPLAEPESFLPPEATVVRIAHPGAIAIALFLRRLSNFAPVAQSVVNLFEPASQRGKQGIDELQEQTVGLLSFKSYATEVFGEQASFTMLPRLGPEAIPALISSEEGLLRDLAALIEIDGCAPMPSLRLVQAPVFHSYTASAWVKFKKPQNASDIAAFFRDSSWDVRDADLGPPTNTGVAGQSGVTLDVIREDSSDPGAVWFWLAADNLRITAENALLTAAAILEQSSRRVQ